MERMCSVVNRLSWYMYAPGIDSAYKKDAQLRVDNGSGESETVPFTPAQLATPLHPSGRWILHMEWDGRSLAHEKEQERVMKNFPYSHYRVVRDELFEPTTTLQEMLDRIAAGSCYGYYDGLEFVGQRDWMQLLPEDAKGLDCYELVWGT